METTGVPHLPEKKADDISIKYNCNLSVVLPYAYSDDINRQKALLVLFDCIVSQLYKRCEIIVVEQSKSGRKFPSCLTVDNHILINNSSNFNKSWCMNVGARAATSENLCFMDGEMKFGNDFFSKIMHFARTNKFFSCWDRLYGEPGRDIPSGRHHIFGKTIFTMGGVFFSTKDFFFNTLGGMNENYFGYGGEDNDLHVRAMHILKSIPAMPYQVTHQYHHWHPANSAFPLNPNRTKILKITTSNPQLVINKLKKARVGNPSAPTLV